MKKNEYVSPEVEIVELETESFIAASDGKGNLEPGIRDDDDPATDDDF